eukprot:COSAG02_NODE_28914_length_579_cov_3.914583_1_plen_27_part_01
MLGLGRLRRVGSAVCGSQPGYVYAGRV